MPSFTLVFALTLSLIVYAPRLVRAFTQYTPNSSYPYLTLAFDLPSSGHVLAHSHTFIPLILLASALGWFFGSSFWSPPRGVSTIVPDLPPFTSTSSTKPPPYIFPSPQTSQLASLPTVSPSFPPPLPPPQSPPVTQPLSPISSPTPNPCTPTLPPPTMPARNDHIAPVFDSHNPRELRKYFSDLDFLFARSRITDSTQQKYHATRFLALDDQDLWESIPEFSDTAASFAQFTAAICHLYPEANRDRRYSLADLESLAAEFAHLQSPSHTRFAEFYRRFFVISAYLLAKNRLSTHEQSRIFVRAIPSNIWHHAQLRLRILFPHVHPLDPYPLNDLRDAIDYILLDPDSHLPQPGIMSTPAPISTESFAPADPSIAAVIDSMNKLIDLISSQQQLLPAASHSDSPPPPLSRPPSCSYCGDPAHFIARCSLVAADIAAGICKRNAEGKVVLPSGLFIPHRFAGPNLRTRIVLWHAANSAHPAPPLTSQASAPVPPLLHAPVPRHRASPSIAPHPAHLTPVPHSAAASKSTFSTEKRLAELQAQLDALRSRTAAAALHIEQSHSTPSQPMLHSPLPPHADLASVYVQHQQDTTGMDTHRLSAPLFASAAAHRAPVSHTASPSDFVQVLSAEKPSPLPRAYPQCAVPHVASPPSLRTQEPQLFQAELLCLSEPQSHTVPLQKSSPDFRANSKFPAPPAVPRAVSQPSSCEQELEPSPIEIGCVRDIQSHPVQSQMPSVSGFVYNQSFLPQKRSPALSPACRADSQ
ncbi:hypothetical protein MSAN_00903500 [Mycena sanguinolenta]|uniref:Uncharacterized protein n=1 Tax=Mycena sanguinolenta TaxID=230812 RepID=A0A8H6YSP8_9AGAR|nr:hypothetical protein MSAN_00903500 [Mycena sanguinolenta]